MRSSIRLQEPALSTLPGLCKSVPACPVVPEYYFNQAIPLEKTERYDDAIKNFEWYLMASPDAKDAKEVSERIGGLKYATEKAGKDAAARRQLDARTQEKQRAQQALRKTLLRSGLTSTTYGMLLVGISRHRKLCPLQLVEWGGRNCTWNTHMQREFISFLMTEK